MADGEEVDVDRLGRTANSTPARASQLVGQSHLAIWPTVRT